MAVVTVVSVRVVDVVVTEVVVTELVVLVDDVTVVAVCVDVLDVCDVTVDVVAVVVVDVVVGHAGTILTASAMARFPSWLREASITTDSLALTRPSK